MASPVCIVLGSAANALPDFEAARMIAPDAPIVCVNDSLRIAPEKPIAFATLHPEKHKRFFGGLDLEGVRLFAHAETRHWGGAAVKEQWGGTSGLFAAQIALLELGFRGVIMAGCPLDHAFGACYPLDKGRTKWANGSEARYQRNWRKALPAIRDRIRSMSGWTQELLGAPDAEWIAALSAIPSEPPAAKLEPPEPGVGWTTPEDWEEPVPRTRAEQKQIVERMRRRPEQRRTLKQIIRDREAARRAAKGLG